MQKKCLKGIVRSCGALVMAGKMPLTSRNMLVSLSLIYFLPRRQRMLQKINSNFQFEI